MTWRRRGRWPLRWGLERADRYRCPAPRRSTVTRWARRRDRGGALRARRCAKGGPRRRRTSSSPTRRRRAPARAHPRRAAARTPTDVSCPPRSASAASTPRSCSGRPGERIGRESTAEPSAPIAAVLGRHEDIADRPAPVRPVRRRYGCRRARRPRAGPMSLPAGRSRDPSTSIRPTSSTSRASPCRSGSSSPARSRPRATRRRGRSSRAGDGSTSGCGASRTRVRSASTCSSPSRCRSRSGRSNRRASPSTLNGEPVGRVEIGGEPTGTSAPSLLGAGWSFGMCAGYCIADLVDRAAIASSSPGPTT